MITTAMLASSTSTNASLAPPSTHSVRPHSSASSRSAASSRPTSACTTSSALHRSASTKLHAHNSSTSTRHSSSTRTNPAGEGQPTAAASSSSLPADSSAATSTTHSILVAGLPSVSLPSTPLASLPPSHRPLFVYYRTRIEAFEAERQDFISRLDTLTQHSHHTTPSTTTTHQSATLTATLTTLQRERSEERLKATDERRRRLECEAAMRSMMSERLADKKRLAQLLAITLPKRTAHQQFLLRNLPQPQHNNENHHHHHSSSTGPATTSKSAPAAAAAAVVAEVEQWKQSATNEKLAREQSDKEWRRQVDVLASERRRREKEWEQRERQLVGWEEEVRRERDRLRVELHEVMSEYMQLRHTAQQNERVAMERLTTLAAQHHQTLTHLHTITHPTTATNTTATTNQPLLPHTLSRSTSTRGDRSRESEYDRPWTSSQRVVDDRIIEYYSGDMHDLQHRNQQLNHRLTQLTQQHKLQHHQYQEQYNTLVQQTNHYRQKYEAECERRTLQCEGYETDVRRLRERLWTLEELLVQLSGTGRAGSGSSGGSGSGGASECLYEMDVGGVEDEIAGMDRQLTMLTERLARSDKSNA